MNQKLHFLVFYEVQNFVVVYLILDKTMFKILVWSHVILFYYDGILFIYDDGIFTEVEILQDYLIV